MKVFVTGGTGVLGRRAVPALVAAGHDVTAVSRRAESDRALQEAGARPVAVDLFDPVAVDAAVAGHDAVVHLATSIPPASSAVRRSAWAANDRLRAEVSRHLVDAALATGAGRYVQESIVFPYAERGDDWATEETPVEHGTATASLALAEGQAERVTAAGGAGVVLRFAMFYAADAVHTAFFNRLARLGINPFLGAGDGFVSMVHADDAGRAVAAAVEAPAGTYNVVDDEPLRRAEVGAVVAAAVGRRRLRRVPTAVLRLLPEPARLNTRPVRASNARLRGATAWRPRYASAKEGWTTTVRRAEPSGG